MDIALLLCKNNSKGLKGKNLLKYKGISLIEHTIKDLKKNKCFQKIFISSESDKILNLAKKLNCEPIRRNKSLTKNSAYIRSVNHACNIIGMFDTLTIAMPVQPLREQNIFVKMKRKLIREKLDSVVTVEKFDASPSWIYRKNKKQIFKLRQIEYTSESARRSDLVYLNNAIVIFTYNSWKKSKSITPWPYLGKKIGFIQQKLINQNIKVDINNYEDYQWLNILEKKKVI